MLEDHKFPSAQSTTSIRKSASCSFRHIGGEKRMACPHRPPLPTSRPISLQFSMTCSHSLLAGSFDCRSRTNSMQSNRPLPRMSPINLYFSFSSLREARILLPMFICLHIFALDYVKNFAALSANHRISAKSVEVKPVPERLRNFGVVTTTPAGNRCRFIWPL